MTTRSILMALAAGAAVLWFTRSPENDARESPARTGRFIPDPFRTPPPPKRASGSDDDTGTNGDKNGDNEITKTDDDARLVTTPVIDPDRPTAEELA